jgi:hypothetical protein
LLLCGGILVSMPVSGQGQETTSLRVAENFRREPNGVVLARLNPGAPLEVVAVDGEWAEVVLEGWTWLRSMRASTIGLDLRVWADGGENLRAEPAGRILGRLEEGTILTELERDPAWARVSRTGWVWAGSLEDAAQVEARPSPEEPPPTGSEAPVPPVGGSFTSIGAVGGPILATPDGDTLAIAEPTGDLEVVRREGNWVRVRLEGWMWLPEGRATAPGVGAEPAAITPEDFADRPEAHVGRVVRWELQFISLERAEAVRTDFFEGEPFLLTRYGGATGPFVYVAVPADRLAEVEGLVPLERVAVTGRVRTGASVLTRAPIVDLISVERSRERR